MIHPNTDWAAVYAAADSLVDSVCKSEPDYKRFIDDNNGFLDTLMRESMKVAINFEAWACDHVDFDQLGEVWPYLLHEKFGSAAMVIAERCNVAGIPSLGYFHNLVLIAAELKLPLLVKT